MTTSLPTHWFKMSALIVFVVLITATPRHLNAQGLNVQSTSYDYDTSSGEFGGDFQIEQTVYLDVDDALDVDAYTETYTGDWEEESYTLGAELDVSANGSYFGGASETDSSDATAEVSGSATPGATYEADGIATIQYEDCLYSCFYGPGDFENQYLGSLSVSVQAPSYADTSGNPPNIDSVTPANGNTGDSGQMTIDGENLLNSDGSNPSLSWYCCGNLSFGSITSASNSEIVVQYSIPSGEGPSLGYIILNTDGGETYGPDFTIGYPPANITALSSYSWTAGSTFTLTLYGTGFGDEPYVYIYDPAFSVSTGAAYNSASDGTSTQVDVTIGSSAPSETATVRVNPAYAATGGALGYLCGSCIGSSSTGTAFQVATVQPLPTVTISGQSVVAISSVGDPSPNTIQLTAAGTPSGGTYSWTSSDGSVSLTNSSSATVTISGTSAVTATLTATYTVSGQSGTATQSVTVQAPNYFVTSSNSGVAQPSACTSAGATGYFIDLSNFVADQNGSRIAVSGIGPSETVLGTTNPAYSTPATTRSDGSFDDTPYGACFGTSGSFCADNDTVTHGASYKGSSFSIPTTYTGRDCTEGIKVVITGNPTGENQTITLGTVY